MWPHPLAEYRDCKDVVGYMLVLDSGLVVIGDGSDGTGDGVDT